MWKSASFNSVAAVFVVASFSAGGLGLVSCDWMEVGTGGGRRVASKDREENADSGRAKDLQAMEDAVARSQMQSEIKKLIAALGDKDYRVREKASKRLAEIGLPALEALEAASANPADPETKTRTMAIIRAIRAANGLPTPVNGMLFEAVMKNREWAVPQPGESTRFQFALKITNTTTDVLRVKLFWKIGLGLRRLPQGEALKSEWAQVNGGPPHTSDPLRKGDSIQVPYEAELVWENNALCAVCRDQFGGTRVFTGLSEGRFSMVFFYGNDEKETDGGDPIWTGRTETIPQIITLKGQ